MTERPYWLPLVRLSGGIRTVHHDLQPLQSMVEGRDLADHPGSPGNLRGSGCAVHRQHNRQGSSLRGRRKRGAQKQAIGRSRGGRTTKIHAIVDAAGRIITFELTEGNRHDIPPAQGLVGKVRAAETMLGDAAYDSDAFRTFLTDRGTTPEIKQNPTRKKLHPFDRTAYRGRNVIERAFCRLKDWRRVATRYDKLARNFAATVVIAAIIKDWL
jgi:transposase